LRSHAHHDPTMIVRICHSDRDRDTPPASARAAPCEPANTAHPRQWASQDLFGEHTEVQIHHAGLCYRLRKTALGKLILTK
jgi:hemin uptake protein HemP